tara:strand:- start:295 stop:597 length:303 start_codon:yes stop_codon:yes gene_type:complete
LKVIHENCDPKLAQDKKLPYTAYLVEYRNEDKTCYDIAIGNSTVEMFDYYYDKYKNVVSWKQSAGQVPPKLWKESMINKPQSNPPERKTRKRKSKDEGEK